MANVLDIVEWEHPTLKQVAAPVADSEFGPQLEAFGAELVATMLAAGNGVGLAAPQVDVSKRVFVMRFPDHEELKSIVVVNPTVTTGGIILHEREGCLSFPGIYEWVARSSVAFVTYQEPLHGKWEELSLTGWDARVCQHEQDHLAGIMFFDRLVPQLRKKVLKRWAKDHE